MTIKCIGFSGTRQGMTDQQIKRVTAWVTACEQAEVARHGMALGADEDFHHIAKALNLFVFGHPGVTKSGDIKDRSGVFCDKILDPKEFLDRNCDIAMLSDVVIVTPAQTEEQLRGSGSWMMIRKVKKLQREGFTVELWIAWPNGTYEQFPKRDE